MHTSTPSAFFLGSRLPPSALEFWIPWCLHVFVNLFAVQLHWLWCDGLNRFYFNFLKLTKGRSAGIFPSSIQKKNTFPVASAVQISGILASVLGLPTKLRIQFHWSHATVRIWFVVSVGRGLGGGCDNFSMNYNTHVHHNISVNIYTCIHIYKFYTSDNCTLQNISYIHHTSMTVAATKHVWSRYSEVNQVQCTVNCVKFIVEDLSVLTTQLRNCLGIVELKHSLFRNEFCLVSLVFVACWFLLVWIVPRFFAWHLPRAN